MTTMGMVFLVGCALLALGAVLYWLDRLLLWMERRGWVYWRMTKRSTGPGVGNALLEIQTLMQPAARHLLELRQEVKEDSPESGDPPSDDTAPGPPEPSNTRSRTLSRNRLSNPSGLEQRPDAPHARVDTTPQEGTMNTNPFQHIDLRVNDLEEAWVFYSKILPAVGFEKGWKGKRFRGFDAHGSPPQQAWFGFTEDKDHHANANRISFWAQSRERVDEIGRLLEDAGARNIGGPRECPDYSPTYYAVFFEDPFGNCLEVCHRED